MRHWLWPIIAALWCPAGYLAARASSKDAPRMEIEGQGVISGKEVSVTRTQRSTVYLGVPFAQSPVGERRFMPPVTDPPATWTGVRDASEYGPACMQIIDDFKRFDRLKLAERLFADDFPISEDCLHLNIFLPDGNAPPEGWPVLLWLHSGNFSVGAASLWDASVFAVKQKVIVVTSGYRLNVFGFFTTQDGFCPGNLGLLDQVAALNWVVDRIESFGGSKDNIVLAGHGAGAESATLHTLSQLSKDKFSRVIAMSGSALTRGAIRDPQRENYLPNIAETLDCDLKSSVELLKCLQAVSADELLSKSAKLANWGPIVDAIFVNDSSAAFLPDSPSNILISDKFNKVELLAGFADMERALSFQDLDIPINNRDRLESQIMAEMEHDMNTDTSNTSTMTCSTDYDFILNSIYFFYDPNLLNENASVYRKKYIEFSTEKYYASGTLLLANHMSKSKEVFLYRFDYKLKTASIIELEEWMTAAHSTDLPFVWGMPYWTSFLQSIVWNNADKKQADLVMSLWGNFTKFSNPTNKGKAVQWEPYMEKSPGILIIDKTLEMSDETTFNYKATRFWNEYYQTIVDISSECCNISSRNEKLQPTGSTYFVATSIHIFINRFYYCYSFLFPSLQTLKNKFSIEIKM